MKAKLEYGGVTKVIPLPKEIYLLSSLLGETSEYFMTMSTPMKETYEFLTNFYEQKAKEEFGEELFFADFFARSESDMLEGIIDLVSFVKEEN